jgi:hypothetical protein
MNKKSRSNIVDGSGMKDVRIIEAVEGLFVIRAKRRWW